MPSQLSSADRPVINTLMPTATTPKTTLETSEEDVDKTTLETSEEDVD